MARLRERLEEMQRRGQRGLIVYLMAGDPDLDTTGKLVVELGRAGVAAVELGVPFSDPIADGPTIQRAAERALAGGTRLTDVLQLVRNVRSVTDVPVLLFTYLNPVLRLGWRRFVREAVDSGVDGALLLDLPPEEAGDYPDLAAEAGLETVFLVAPTSTPGRVKQAARLSTGFVYVVSRTGVTGAREKIPAEVRETVDLVRRTTSAPVAVGFGISRPEHVRAVTAFADAAVVGSALVQRIEQQATTDEAVREAVSFVRTLMSGLED